ncbi:MAG: hypothetical protein IJQ21_02320 [Lachnospiraceae bacterium]|nr:hypothetical protein [Lachnospiraceae bacterium]
MLLSAPEKKGYVLGYDLGAKYSQISYLPLSGGDAQTLSVLTGAQIYDIPTILAKREDVNQWFYGREAKKQIEEGLAVAAEGMMEAAVEGTNVVVGDAEYDPVALLALFVKRSLSLLTMELDAAQIRGIMFTCAGLDNRMVNVLRGVVDALQLPMKHVYFQDYAESFYHFMLSQDKELRTHTVLACDYHYGPLTVLSLNFNFHTTPVIATVDEQVFSEMEYNLDDLPDDISYREKATGMLDTEFLRIAERLCAGKVVSTVYLLGNGFKEGWMRRSLEFLCRTRKVYQGSNLFSKGAAYAARARLKKGTEERAFLLLDDSKLRHNIGLQVHHRGREEYCSVLEGGCSWYEAHASLDVILESGNTFMIRVTPLAGGETAEVPFEMKTLPEREARTTRLTIEMEMLSAGRVRVTVTDRGFGTYQESSGEVWTQEVNLS